MPERLTECSLSFMWFVHETKYFKLLQSIPISTNVIFMLVGLFLTHFQGILTNFFQA